MSVMALSPLRPSARLLLALVGVGAAHLVLVAVLAMSRATAPTRPLVEHEIWLEMEPWPSFGRQAAPVEAEERAALPPRAATPSPAAISASEPSGPSASPGAEISAAPTTAPSEEELGDRIARSLRTRRRSCDSLPTSGERDGCIAEALQHAAGAPPLMGSGDGARDARFSAEGARELAGYERRRQPLNPNSRARPCPQGPQGRNECDFALRLEWSSRTGFSANPDPD